MAMSTLDNLLESCRALGGSLMRLLVCIRLSFHIALHLFYFGDASVFMFVDADATLAPSSLSYRLHLSLDVLHSI